MKKNLHFLVLLLFSGFPVLNLAQLSLEITTNKTEYSYGEPIEISCLVTNTSDTTFSVMASCYDSWQAEFYLNDFYSGDWTACLTLMQELVFAPHAVREYKWIFQPERYGYPKQDGTQMLIGEFFYDDLKDTIWFSAPRYHGGQLEVTFPIDMNNSLDSLRDSLSVTVLQHDEFPSLSKTTEMWQIEGFDIDSVFSFLGDDTRLVYVDYNRHTEYESVVVSVENAIDNPADEFYLSNAYPNPFNPTTTFYVSLPEQMDITIELYNSLGQSVQKIFKGELNANQRYRFEISGSGLSSGIYYYNVSGRGFSKTGKVALLK